MQPFWVAMQWHPNSDYEHFLLVCGHRKPAVEPFVLGLWHEGNCSALLLGRRESILLNRKIGYFNSPGIRATTLTIVYAGLLGALDVQGAGAILAELKSRLRRGEADLLILNLLPENGPFWSLLPKHRLIGHQPSSWSVHRELHLRPTPGFLLSDMRAKHRYWIKRKNRELEAAFPDKVRWIWFSSFPELALLCSKLELVARQTYQRGLKAGFIDDAETRARLGLIARRGQLRVCLLEIDGVPKAFWLGEVYKNVFHSAATGYTPDVQQFEVGTLLFLRVVDELVKEGVLQLDFGLGDAHYKKRFGDRSWREGTAYMYAPTPKGLFLEIYFGFCEILDRILRRLLGRLRIVDYVKKVWRRKIGGNG